MNILGNNIPNEKFEDLEFYKDMREAGVEIEEIREYYTTTKTNKSTHLVRIWLKTDLKTYDVKLKKTTIGDHEKYTVSRRMKNSSYRPDLVVYYSDSFDKFYSRYFSDAEYLYGIVIDLFKTAELI